MNENEKEKLIELEKRILFLEKKSDRRIELENHIIAFAMQLARIELFKGILESNGDMFYFQNSQRDSESFTRINLFQLVASAKQIIIEQTKE